ncbi:uncharacterized protein TNCV_3309191 [Trichonephila clavipes]|nr:uncharacterized protein TNCV_3309191 [Trichonephila clavipes]
MPRFKNIHFKKKRSTGLHSRPKVSKSFNNLNVSASAKKLKSFLDYKNLLGENGNINEIINMTLLSEAIKISVVCKECKNNSISIKCLRKVQGLATEFSVSCETCGFSQPFLNTDTYMFSCNGKECKYYEVNTRLSYAMRCIGKGESSSKILCGVMNLPTLSQRFNEKESGLDAAIETVATVSMQTVAKEAKDVNGHSEIPVAIDGTWQKRGHTSLNGAVIATSVDTGKVLDASILSRFCKCPNKTHNENCKANHFGNRSMEVSGAMEIFQRLHGLRCTKFLGDGDSRAYKTVNEMQPYGDTYIDHVE